MRNSALGCICLLLLVGGCPSSDGTVDETGGWSEEPGYCATWGAVDVGAPGSEKSHGWACSDAPAAQVLYASSELEIGSDLFAGTGSLAIDDSSLYLSIDSRESASGTFRLEKDGSGITKLSDIVLEDLVVANGSLYGVSDAAIGGNVVRVDTKTGDTREVAARGDTDGLRRSPDGRLFVLRARCEYSPSASSIDAFDPESGSVVAVVQDACITSFAVGTSHIAWTERAEDDGEESIHVAAIDGSERRLVTDPPGDPLVLNLQIAHGHLYFAVDYAFPDADLVRVPIGGQTPECVAHVALSANAVADDALFSLDSPHGPPGCFVRHAADGTASVVAQVNENAINSEIVVDGEYAYAVSLTWDGPVIVRIPAR